MGKKLRKEYLIDYSLLIGENLQQANNQILLIILLKEFVKLNLNMDKKIENEKRVELNSNIESPLEYTNVKGNLLEQKCLCCCKNYQKDLMKKR